MSQPDRRFLEDICPFLLQKLLHHLVDEPQSRVDPQNFQDLEVWYELSAKDAADPTIRLKVHYPFLAGVLDGGSEALLERVWGGLPLRLDVDRREGELGLELDTSRLGDEAERRRCAQVLAMTRSWLLIGPLVERLRWLRKAVADGSQAAATAAPGNAAAAAAAAVGTPPPPVVLQLRRGETCWIVAKEDRVLVIMSIHLDDEVDMALGRAFCQEFAETNRKPTDFSLPCSFCEPKEPPNDVRGSLPAVLPNVGFLTLTLSDQCVRGASEERLYALARPVMTFRNFFHFHLKHAKSFLHSRLRKRLDGWQQTLNRARRVPKPGQEKRRLVSGKEFVPKAAGSAAAASAAAARG